MKVDFNDHPPDDGGGGQAAFAYFERYRDKVYSFVDCLSFVVMDKYGIQEAWTVDGDFSHRFTARPGSAPDSRSPKR